MRRSNNIFSPSCVTSGDKFYLRALLSKSSTLLIDWPDGNYRAQLDCLQIPASRTAFSRGHFPAKRLWQNSSHAEPIGLPLIGAPLPQVPGDDTFRRCTTRKWFPNYLANTMRWARLSRWTIPRWCSTQYIESERIRIHHFEKAKFRWLFWRGEVPDCPNGIHPVGWFPIRLRFLSRVDTDCKPLLPWDKGHWVCWALVSRRLDVGLEWRKYDRGSPNRWVLVPLLMTIVKVPVRRRIIRDGPIWTNRLITMYQILNYKLWLILTEMMNVPFCCQLSFKLRISKCLIFGSIEVHSI